MANEPRLGGESVSVKGFVGKWYLHDGDENKGGRSVTYTVKIEKAGKYDVRVSYTPSSNRATNTPVTIQTAGGAVTKKINQKKVPPIAGSWISLGVYEFKAGKTTIVISNKGTDGHVIADAVQLLPVK